MYKIRDFEKVILRRGKRKRYAKVVLAFAVIGILSGVAAYTYLSNLLSANWTLGSRAEQIELSWLSDPSPNGGSSNAFVAEWYNGTLNVTNTGSLAVDISLEFDMTSLTDILGVWNPVASSEVYVSCDGHHLYWASYGDERSNIVYRNYTLAGHESLLLEISVWFYSSLEPDKVGYQFVMSIIAINPENCIAGIDAEPPLWQDMIPT